MATRATKGKAAASNPPAIQQETPQFPAVQDPKRQLEPSEYNNAPEPSNSVRSQVQELAQSQAHTEIVLLQILQRITKLGNGQPTPSLHLSSYLGSQWDTTPFV